MVDLKMTLDNHWPPHVQHRWRQNKITRAHLHFFAKSHTFNHLFRSVPFLLFSFLILSTTIWEWIFCKQKQVDSLTLRLMIRNKRKKNVNRECSSCGTRRIITSYTVYSMLYVCVCAVCARFCVCEYVNSRRIFIYSELIVYKQAQTHKMYYKTFVYFLVVFVCCWCLWMLRYVMSSSLTPIAERR